jgi:hypothetical protein
VSGGLTPSSVNLCQRPLLLLHLRSREKIRDETQCATQIGHTLSPLGARLLTEPQQLVLHSLLLGALRKHARLGFLQLQAIDGAHRR